MRGAKLSRNRAGVSITAYNQRDIAGLLVVIRHLGATIGQGDRAAVLAGQYERRLTRVAARTQNRSHPKVHFEECDEPMISGGDDIFPEHVGQATAKDRFVTQGQGIEATPDVILASSPNH